MSDRIDITLRVNGTDYPVSVDMSRNLLSVIRTEVGLTGTKEGCDDCECGACMVLLDGQPVQFKSPAEAIRAGVHGYLLKEIDGKGLVQAIREVAHVGDHTDHATRGTELFDRRRDDVERVGIEPPDLTGEHLREPQRPVGAHGEGVRHGQIGGEHHRVLLAGRVVDHAQDIEQCGFAAARRSHDGHVIPDLDLAVDGIVWSAFGTTGQRCTASSRLIVTEGIHDRFIDAFQVAGFSPSVVMTTHDIFSLMNLVGGGGMLRGLASRIERETEVPVRMSNQPLEAVVLGAGHCIENYQALRGMFMGNNRIR